jgi:5-methylcytosine-specific restriction endonuclease McrA
LYSYVVEELELGENIALSLITVARKAREIPELKTQLEAGNITLTNARRVVSVMTPENKSEWIQKASDLSSRELEKEIVREPPKEATPERTSYVSEGRIKLELGLSEREMLRLRRVQDILSQSQKRQVSLEETLEQLTCEYLGRHDLLQKAARSKAKKEKAASLVKPDSVPVDKQNASQLVARREPTRRKPIPADVRHEVNLRDQQRCAFILPSGLRCNQTRWIEIHHKKPVSQGGLNMPENLMTLCSGHHKLLHLTE